MEKEIAPIMTEGKHENLPEGCSPNATRGVGVQCEDSGTNLDALLHLDDEALFGIIKKLACNGLRQILSGSIDHNAGSSCIPTPKTPPSCNIDGSNFKKTLFESICAYLYPQILDDVTALYLKHASSSNEPVPVLVGSVIVDLINYFSHRAETDMIPHTDDHSGFVAPKNNEERDVTVVGVKSHAAAAVGVKSHAAAAVGVEEHETAASEDHIAIVYGHVSVMGSQQAAASPLGPRVISLSWLC